MSTPEAPSALTRLIPPLTIVALILMIAGAIFHVSQLGNKPAPPFSRDASPKAPDFTEGSAWYLRPEASTEGGWVTPWGVDVFWISDTNVRYASGWNAPFDWLDASSALQPDFAFLSALSKEVGVYAPKRRFAARLNGSAIDRTAARNLESEDVLKAFDSYVSEDHRLRGVFLGARDEGLGLAAKLYSDRLKGTQPFDILFGGVIAAGLSETAISETFPGLQVCQVTPSFPCVLNLNGSSSQASAEKIVQLMSDFSAWLDANAAKPAEPLPPIEIIDIAPINKPKEQ